MPVFTFRLYLLLGLLGLPALSTTLQAKPTTSAVAPAPKGLEFVQNKGQWDAQAHFAADLPAGRLFLTSTGFSYSFADPVALRAYHEHKRTDATPPGQRGLRTHSYRVSFEGGNSKAIIEGEEATAEVRNYFLGKDPSHWASQVGSFRQVRYRAVYPGIDVHLYENASQTLEYDFTVRAGAKPEAIRLRYQGAQSVSLTPEGGLRIRTSVGDVLEQAPKAWQIRPNGEQVPVECAFQLRDNVLSFRLGNYDRKLPLIIDPTVVFSSFTGSTADNWGFTATYDAQGNMYSGGVAFSLGYPTTTGAVQTTFAGIADIAIIKYNTAVAGSTSRLYATYLGGGQVEVPHSLVVNNRNELVILGTTGSNNYPVTTKAFARSFSGGQFTDPLNEGSAEYLQYANGSDLVISTLSANGGTLVASTYLGGSANDGLNLTGSLVNNYGDQFRGDVITDSDNNVYLASTTLSTNFPTRNGFGTTAPVGANAVVSKLTADLSTLVWSNYLGGSGAEAAYSIQLGPARSVVVAGGTTSTNFPVTAGSLMTTAPAGVNGFVARIAPAGNSITQATYIGTPGNDQAYFAQLDADDNVYLLGQSSGNYPVTAGRYSRAGSHQFIHKLNPTLSQTAYSTVFGTGRLSYDFSPTAFLVDDCERIYVCGWGGSTNAGYGLGSSSTTGLPVTNDAVQRNTDGSDFYLAEFTPGMASLEYATFFGENGGRGEHVDGGTSRFDKRGMVYQAVCGGCSGTQGFPVPPGASYYSTRNGSFNCNNAAFKMDFGIVVADPGLARYVCASSAPIVLGGSPAGGTWSGPGVSANPGGGFRFTPTAGLVGRQVLTYAVASTGICVSRRPLRITVLPDVAVSIAPIPELCIDATNITVQATPTGGTWSGPGVLGNIFSPRQAGVGTHTITYTMSDTLGCGVATRQIIVRALPQVTAGAPLTLCAYETQAIQLLGASPAGGTWSGPGVTPSGLFTPPNTNLKGANITLTYSYNQNGCVATATKQIVLAPSPTSSFPLNVPECISAPQYTGLAPFTHQFEPVLAGGIYEWDFGDGSPKSTEASPSHVFEQPGTYNVKLVARYANCTVETGFVPVVVGDVFVPNIITPGDDNKNDTFIPRFSCQPATLRIFSRWGNKVYETANYRNDWRGENLPDGMYYYHLRDAEGRSVKGWVQVKR
ncbi:gliding motility-associated C-terminal domain-containing protein [Hymenobacter gelipurpurascens]|uniref:Gliding motility-associated C-terminal domain-containing protein n=1 Tax=Hymenobacter gelipurpurascens TaxID=89968 RepID=A0A212UCN6_9BACT|nr:gliding motility-associated C-terminal domain-containing protein [Hymenobacter gelipurpurascens]SNC75851.1 gliding motility-associated C-terminal domain-containing protein [Hymenobacter gelipurpurascens]